MSLKRKLTQDDLRKAMSEHKKKIGTVKKIESPLAKYTDSGQLMCVLCKMIVRNENVWSVHLATKIHRENIALAKKTKLETEPKPTSTTPSFKRPPSPPQESSANKRLKGILKSSNKSSTTPQQTLPADFFDNAQSNGVVSNSSISLMQKSKSQESTDVEIKNNETETDKEKEKIKETQATVLPEGFFDDPVMDAKARNVEYKDPIEEEWEKFQKEIKEETAQSQQIIADDQEEATTERQLDEIEEQIRHWSRVMDLVKRKEEVQATDRRQDNVDKDISSGDEAEYDEFLDWRAKSSYK